LLFTPSPRPRVYNSKKGGGGSSSPVRDTDYTCSVEFSSDIVPIIVKRCQYALNSSDQLCLVLRGIIPMDYSACDGLVTLEIGPDRPPSTACCMRSPRPSNSVHGHGPSRQLTEMRHSTTVPYTISINPMMNAHQLSPPASIRTAVSRIASTTRFPIQPGTLITINPRRTGNHPRQQRLTARRHRYRTPVHNGNITVRQSGIAPRTSVPCAAAFAS
jgi:hypothetical protein